MGFEITERAGSWLELLSVGRSSADDPEHQFEIINSLSLQKTKPWEVCKGETD